MVTTTQKSFWYGKSDGNPTVQYTWNFNQNNSLIGFWAYL